jgi:hypothetical protein
MADFESQDADKKKMRDSLNKVLRQISKNAHLSLSFFSLQ